MAKKGLAIIVSAPSGTGKTTVCARLRERMPGLRFKVSHTTRPPREGEVDGVHYHFISESEFQRRLKEGDFLEWARVHGHYYGTARQTVEDHLQRGEDLLMELDVQGVASLRAMEFDGVFIFILPPSLEELEKRLMKRGTEPPEKIRQRLETAKAEIIRYRLYDYVVTNHEVDDTVETVQTILKSEPFRSHRFQPESPDIQALIKTQVSV